MNLLPYLLEWKMLMSQTCRNGDIERTNSSHPSYASMEVGAWWIML